MATEKEKAKVLALYQLWCESFLNFLDYVYVEGRKGGIVKFQKWPHMLEAIEAFESNRYVIALKARQIGFSTLVAAYALWTIITKEAATVLIISQTEAIAANILAKAKLMCQYLPEEYQLELSPDSALRLGIKGQHSEIVALASTPKAGRGYRATLVICDEWDHHESFVAEANFAALKPTIEAGGKFIGLSTCNKEDAESFFKRIFRDAMAGDNNFKWLFYGWRVVPDRDDAWYKAETRDMPSWQVEQEYPNSVEEALAPLVGTSVFDRDAVLKLLEIAALPEQRERWVYIIHPPVVGTKYVAAADVGEGVGLDYSALTIVGKKGLSSEVCAVIWGNDIKTDYYAYMCEQLCKEYFKPVLAVENNGLGIAVLNKLEELRYPNLYFQKTPTGQKRPKPGWSTNAVSRLAAIGELVTAIRDESLITRFKPQVLEMMNFYWKPTKEGSRPEAARGTHDDLVMSLVIAYQMLKEVPSYGPAPHIPMVYRK